MAVRNFKLSEINLRPLFFLFTTAAFYNRTRQLYHYQWFGFLGVQPEVWGLENSWSLLCDVSCAGEWRKTWLRLSCIVLEAVSHTVPLQRRAEQNCPIAPCMCFPLLSPSLFSLQCLWSEMWSLANLLGNWFFFSALLFGSKNLAPQF